MWKMRRRSNWEPPHTTKRDWRERWVRSYICTCCLKSSSMICLSRLTSAFLFYFRATVWKVYLQNEVAKSNVVRCSRHCELERKIEWPCLFGRSRGASVKGLTHKWLAKLFTGGPKTCHKLELWQTDSVRKRNRSVRYRMRRNSSGLGM